MPDQKHTDQHDEPHQALPHSALLDAQEWMQAMIETPHGGNVERTLAKKRKEKLWRKRMIQRLNKHHMISFI